MRFSFSDFLPFRELPLGRALVLTAIAILLAAADWLPDNRYVDPDHLEFLLTVALGGTAIFLAVGSRMRPENVAAWRNRLILLTFALVLAALGAEFATRWVFRAVTTSSDFGGYFSRRWASTEVTHTNHAGFREREYANAKPPGTYRVAVVGDSFTYGNGIPQQSRFSDLLQARLPSHIEVLNFGQPGANTPEHRHLVQTLLNEAQPDFILLQWYVNDSEDDDSTGRPTFQPIVPFRPLHYWLNNNSALYTVANMKWAEAQVALGMTMSYTDYLQHRLGDPNSHDSRLDRDLLNDLIASAERKGVPIGIVLFPDTAAPIDDHYPFGYLHDRVLETCGAHHITCVDLRDDFAGVRDRESLWANRLDHHPSARANAIAAEKLLQAYSTVWVAGK